MANLYFTDTAMTDETSFVTLTGDEARHAVQVARVRVGDTFDVSDGRGWRGSATVLSADKALVECSVSTVHPEPARSPRFVLAQALAKGDRDELAIQMATELGVDSVIPWQADRSVSRWSGDKVTKGVARWSSIVREASKQAMRSRIPTVSEPLATTALIGASPQSTWIVLDPRGDTTLTEWFDRASRPVDIGIIVGPEGGVTDAEIDRLRKLGATPVRLDGPVLRTSTAGPSAIAAVLALSGAW